MNNKALLEKLERADKELKRLHVEEELSRLRNENEQLSKTVIDAIDKIKVADDTAENYHKMFDQLLHVIRSRYDADFKIEDLLAK